MSQVYRKRGGHVTARLRAKDRLVKNTPKEKTVRTKLDGGLIDAIANVVRSGNFPITAAMAHGIPASTFSNWMHRGEADLHAGNETVFAELAVNVSKARAEGEIVLAEMGLELVKGGKNTWMGAYRHLESYARERWNRSTDININAFAKVEHAIDVPPDPPQSHAEWLLRREERNLRELEAVDADFSECVEDE